MSQYQKEREFAVTLAVQCGELIIRAVQEAGDAVQRGWGTGAHTELKTLIDATVDRHMRARTGERFPEDAIWSEEDELKRGTSNRLWVFDPIDGTINLQGMLKGMFCAMIALVVNGKPVLGVIYRPYTEGGGAIWIGEIGEPSMHSDRYGEEPLKEIHVSGCVERNRALGLADCGKHNRRDFIQYQDKLWDNEQGVTHTCLVWTAGQPLAAVADGDLDFACATLNPEDILPATPIIQGAGGTVTTIKGEELEFTGNEKTMAILAANPVLHKDLLAYLNS